METGIEPASAPNPELAKMDAVIAQGEANLQDAAEAPRKRGRPRKSEQVGVRSPHSGDAEAPGGATIENQGPGKGSAASPAPNAPTADYSAFIAALLKQASAEVVRKTACPDLGLTEEEQAGLTHNLNALAVSLFPDIRGEIPPELAALLGIGMVLWPKWRIYQDRKAKQAAAPEADPDEGIARGMA